jgi:hypothetical protein
MTILPFIGCTYKLLRQFYQTLQIQLDSLFAIS